MIVFENVTKTFGKHSILKDINLVVSSGEFVSLVGKSGAGKSTLIKMLSGQVLPTRGDVKVDDMSIPNLNAGKLQQYRRRIGVVHQDFLLLDKKTVYENVAFAMEVCGYGNREISKRVSTTLEIVGLGGKENCYPHELSGGEKQRAAIARALIHKPNLLLADEPTGNLDPENSDDIFDILMKINSLDTTIILTTHDDTRVNKIKKRVVLIDQGRIVSDREQGRYR